MQNQPLQQFHYALSSNSNTYGLDELRQQIYEKELELAQKAANLRYVVEAFLIAIFFATFTAGFGIYGYGGGAFFFGFMAFVSFSVCVGLLASSEGKQFTEYNNVLNELKILRLRLKQAETSNFQSLGYRNQYLLGIPEIVTSLRKKANAYRGWYFRTQITIIFVSIIITGLSGLNVQIPYLILILSVIVSFTTALSTLFRFKDKGHNLQQTADDIDLEYNAYRLLIHDYSNLDDKAALTRLAERVESLRGEQQKRQQQLDQDSQTDQNVTKSARKTQSRSKTR